MQHSINMRTKTRQNTFNDVDINPPKEGGAMVSFYDSSQYAPFLSKNDTTVGDVVRSILALRVPVNDIEGLEGLEMTMLERMVLVQALKAARGNLAAFQELVKHHSYEGAERIAISQKTQIQTVDRGSLELMRIMGMTQDQVKYSMGSTIPAPKADKSSFLD